MPSIRCIAIAAALCLTGAGAYAQDVDDIINHNIDALGGKDKLEKLTSLYEEASGNIMGNDLPIKVWVVSDVGVRVETDIMGQMMIQTIYKDTGWMVNPMSGNTDPIQLNDKSVAIFKRRMQLGGPFFNYKEKGFTATLKGKEVVNGKDTYKIVLSKPGEADATYYVDATTWYIDKSTTFNFIDGKPVMQDLFTNAYMKTPEGYAFPKSYSQEIAQGELVTTVSKVVVNQPIDTVKFQKP